MLKPKSYLKLILGLRQEMPWGFYISGFFFKYLLRKNTRVAWMVHHTSTVDHPQNIQRGKNVFPGDSPGNYIDAEYGITIGDFTNIGPNLILLTKNHDAINNDVYSGKPITIGAFCWIGMNAVLLPGVTLGDFTVVAAGAVVTRSFEEGYGIIAGNPAVLIKKSDQQACEEFRKSKY